MSWAAVPVLSVGSVLTAAAWNAVADNMADSGWVVPSLANSWRAYSGYTVGYRLIGNLLRLRGAISSGTTGVAAFTLPTGYFATTNPYYSFVVADISGNAEIVQIDGSTGGVLPLAVVTAVCLDGVTLWVD